MSPPWHAQHPPLSTTDLHVGTQTPPGAHSNVHHMCAAVPVCAHGHTDRHRVPSFLHSDSTLDWGAAPTPLQSDGGAPGASTSPCCRFRSRLRSRGTGASGSRPWRATSSTWPPKTSQHDKDGVWGEISPCGWWWWWSSMSTAPRTTVKGDL